MGKHRRVCYLELTNRGRGDPSRVSKVPDVKASEYKKVKDIANTGENQEDTSGSLKVNTFGFYG